MKKTLTLLLLLAGLTLDAQAETLTWNGSESQMTWNTSDDNWLLGENAAQNADGDAVEFGDTGTLQGDIHVAPGETLTLTGDISNIGKIILDGGATLDLGGKSISNIVELNGDFNSIGNGSLSQVVFVLPDKTFTLIGDLFGNSSFEFFGKNDLKLCGHILSADVSVFGPYINIDTGTVNGQIEFVPDPNLLQQWFFISGDISGTRDFVLADKCSLSMRGSGSTLSKGVTVLSGYAALSGYKFSGRLTVEKGGNADLGFADISEAAIILKEGATVDMGQSKAGLHQFTFAGRTATVDKGTLLVESQETIMLTTNLSGSATISMGRDALLDLDEHSLSNSVTLTGDASIGNGTLNGKLTVGKDMTLTLSGALSGTGAISLGDNATLDLGEHSLGNSVSLIGGSANIGNGSIAGCITVNGDSALTLIGDLSGTGSITLRDNATLILGEYTLSSNITLEGNATIGISVGSFNGDINVNAEKTLTLNNTLNGTGSITLGDNAALDLGTGSLSRSVSLAGDSAKIGNGKLNSALSVGEKKTLSLIGDLSGEGAISLGDNATLDLGKYTLSNSVSLARDSAKIGNGKLNSALSVGEEKTLTLLGDLSGTGGISLGGNATLDLGKYTLSNSVSLAGNSAKIGNGKLNSALSVGDEKMLSLIGDLSCTGGITIGDTSTLDLGRKLLTTDIAVTGNAVIGGGTLNGSLSVAADKTLYLFDNVSGTGSISLGDNATLNLGNNTLSKDVIITGSGKMGNGTLAENVTVAADKKLSLAGDLDGEGTIILGDKATLDLGGYTLSNSVSLAGKSAYIGNNTIGSTLNGALIVGDGKTLILLGNMGGRGTVTLGNDSVLALGGHTLSNEISVEGDAFINSGTIAGDVNVSAGKKLYLVELCSVTGKISLGENAMLDLGNNSLSQSIYLEGSASIGNGTLIRDLAVSAGKTLALCGNLSGPGGISLGSDATLNLGGNALSSSVILTRDASIGNGTIDGSVTVHPGGSARFTGETRIDKGSITAGATTVKALKEDSPGLLQELSVTNGLIAGTDRQTSLADGLRIESSASLMIKSMTITADNKISVGQNTITLNQVTIDLSTAKYELVDSVYYFQLRALINCNLAMDDVVFDASAFELPTGFDPLVNGIGMDFGPDVTIDPQTAKNLTLLMGDYMSQTVSFIEGKPVFTALVPLPEPATGTLGLLALAALSSRRRRK